MKKILAVVLVAVMAQTAHSQVIWRSAKTLAKGQMILMSSNYMTPFDKSYSWSEGKWIDHPEDRTMTFSGLNTMFGIGLTDRIELTVNVPVECKSAENGGVETSASGIGDMYIKTRIAVLPWTKTKGGLALLGAVRLGTGDKDADIALGDGTTDIVMGALYSTGWKNGWRGHLRAAYWLNGKTDTDVDVGDEVKMIVKLDKNFSAKWMGFLTYIPYMMMQRKDADGNTVDNTEKTRHYLSAGVVWKPVKGLFIRPKVLLPVWEKGGSSFSVKPLVDVWYTFSLFK